MTALVLLPLAHAGQATLTDPAGDQELLGLGEEFAYRCSDAATDIRGMDAFARDGALVLQLHVRDAGSSHVTCEGTSYATEYLDSFAELNAAPVCQELIFGRVCDAPGDGVAVSAGFTHDAYETRSCIVVHFAEGLTSECLGEATLVGSTLTWSIPLAGAVLVENGDTRTYDLSGREFVPSAGTASYFTPAPNPLGLELGIGIMAISDDIAPEVAAVFTL